MKAGASAGGSARAGGAQRAARPGGHLLPGSTSLPLWQQLREAAIPVGAYWALLVFAYGCFAGAVTASKVLKGGMPDGEDVVALVLIALICFGGAAIGQVLAFLRVRTWIVLVFGALCWAAAFGTALAGAAGAGTVAALAFLALFLLPFAITGGLWSLETHRALWATWLPLLLVVGAVIGWIENVTGWDANWHAGNKWAIWDPGAFFFLAGAVVLTLVYLVARETHRLALWRRGPTAPLQPTLKEKGVARPRMTFLGCGALLVGALGLTVATALVAPYLWRTGDDGDGGGEPTEQPAEPYEAPAEPTEGDGSSEFVKRMKEMAEQAVEAAKEASGSLCSVLGMALLALLGVLIAWRPLKRLFLVRHLKEPFWRVSATTRIEQGWRLVEIALADAGVHPRPGEDARGLARRARPVLEKLSPVDVHGLEDAAEVADRVRFGLGVAPEDEETMRRFSAWAIDTVWERLSDAQQVRCMYRGV